MSGDVEPGSSRPRPLSGGFWTLLSWLRREDQSSSESLSSAGSDRTAVSFAFLAPAHYHSGAPPIVLPPQGPPSDTYKRRVRDRNLRRHYDRDTTLHRKYGLVRGEGGTLPPARLERLDRERRAASESLQRRAPHVPGKRRAPPPPAHPQLTGARRHSRKRTAPQPPAKLLTQPKDTPVDPRRSSVDVIQMSARSARDAREASCPDESAETECKPEKFTRKEESTGVKIRSEKSFLKQIFENRKRNSAIDISAIKVLPSISELDKQAAEIIENNKQKYIEEINRQKSSKDIVNCCPNCFKVPCHCNSTEMLPTSSTAMNHKNASTMYTQTENKSHNAMIFNKNTEIDEKQKLKDMLKEMKDSLPKRPKQESKACNFQQMKIKASTTLSGRDVHLTDTPTLRIGTSSSYQVTKSISPIREKQPPLEEKKELPPSLHTRGTEPPIAVEDKRNILNASNTPLRDPVTSKQSNNSSNEKEKLHTPLKISSLLNPIYVPRNTSIHQQNLPKTLVSEVKDENKKPAGTSSSDPVYVKTADTVRDIILNSAFPGNQIPNISEPQKSGKSLKDKSSKSTQSCFTEKSKIFVNETDSKKNNCLVSVSKNGSNVEKLREHSRRRELVNQLEQSIAKGDERAAADAAAKLAQLRLSCSVLSFSSQILGESSTSSTNVADKSISPNPKTDTKLQNDNEPVKSTETSSGLQPKIKESTSTKINKVESGSKGLETKTNSSSSTPAQIKENKVVSKLPLALASTSKGTITNKVIGDGDNVIPIKIWIEDKEKARGPIQMHVEREASVGDLRQQAERSLGLPARLQRWIVGRTLCTDDKMLLVSLAGPNLQAPFYLCLVESDTTNGDVIDEKANEAQKGKEDNKAKDIQSKPSGDVYTELVNLERQALVPNTETFECEICMEQCDSGGGVVLRECVHSFCRRCLADVIRHCEEPTVSCPGTGCPGELHEREIRALVSPDEYQRWLARGLAAAESGTRNAFHCRTRDCTGWALCDTEVRRFPCPVCKHTNCIPCQAIHENDTCEQYQKKIAEATVTAITTENMDGGTQALIDSLISRGEALQCPECSTVITKKWGCDWVKCSACKTEICWVTRGRRWGPGGRGDTSGGCRCGVDGKRCHPSCGYCH